jgi:hypothetical protein
MIPFARSFAFVFTAPYEALIRRGKAFADD